MLTNLLEENAEYRNVFATKYEHAEAKFIRYANEEATQVKRVMNERKWTWTILQEQSEIPGMWEVSDEFDTSFEALGTLNEWIAKNGGDTLLLMTWGRHTFDKYNPTLYPDFVTMQQRLAEGYYRYQEEISTEKRPVKIIPAGLAYKAIYDTSSPNATALFTDFSRLYEDHDSAHLGYPSMAGSYLTACVMYATISGNDVRKSKWAPDGVDPTFSERLRAVAAETVERFDKNGPGKKKPDYVPTDGRGGNSTKKKGHPVLIFLLLLAIGGYDYYNNRTLWDMGAKLIQMIQYRLRFSQQYSYSQPVARQGTTGQELSYFTLEGDGDTLL